MKTLRLWGLLSAAALAPFNGQAAETPVESLDQAVAHAARSPGFDYRQHTTWYQRTTSQSFPLPALPSTELASSRLALPNPPPVLEAATPAPPSDRELELHQEHRRSRVIDLAIAWQQAPTGWPDVLLARHVHIYYPALPPAQRDPAGLGTRCGDRGC